MNPTDMLFEIVDGQPLPVLLPNADGSPVVRDGRTVLSLVEAATRTGHTAAWLARFHDAARARFGLDAPPPEPEPAVDEHARDVGLLRDFLRAIDLVADAHRFIQGRLEEAALSSGHDFIGVDGAAELLWKAREELWRQINDLTYERRLSLAAVDAAGREGGGA
jgi:hypothetical protein